MSKRTELLEQEAAYKKALGTLGQPQPEPYQYQLENENYGYFGFLTYRPAKDQTEIVIGGDTVYLNAHEALQLLDALRTIYE
jgi:hypothetical protein